MGDGEPSDDWIGRIKKRLQPLLEAEERSRQLLGNIPSARVFVGMCGVRLDCDSFALLKGYATIRNVANPPGVVHVARAADPSRTDYLGVSRYSPGFTAEIAFGDPRLDPKYNELPLLLNLSYHAAAMMKLRSGSALFCPAYASCSWDAVAAVADHSVQFGMLDDVPRRVGALAKGVLVKTQVVSADVLHWLDRYWDDALELRNFSTSRRFGLAFNVMYTWNHTGDLRTALANLWVGLEALFSVKGAGLTSRLVDRISAWLPSTSKKKIRHLYDVRSRAVHGAWLDDAMTEKAVAETQALLRAALIKCIETNSKTLPDWR